MQYSDAHFLVFQLMQWYGTELIIGLFEVRNPNLASDLDEIGYAKKVFYFSTIRYIKGLIEG